MTSNPMNFDQLINRRCIDLSFNGLHDGNVDVLIDVIRKTEVLHSLNLWGNRLSLEGNEGDDDRSKLADAIARNSTIRVLSLGSNDIGASGGKRLAEALRVNSTIVELHLGDNRLGDEGVRDIALALSSSNGTIATLGLYGNGITDIGAGYLASSIGTNVGLRDIWLHANRMSEVGYNDIVNAVKDNDNIEHVLLLSEKHDGDIRAILDARKVVVGAAKGQVPPSSIMQNDNDRELLIALSAKDEEIAKLKAALQARDLELKAKNEEIAALLDRAAAVLSLERNPTTTTSDDTIVSNPSIVKKGTIDIPSFHDDDDVRDDINDYCHDDEGLSLHPALSVE
ncbi:hypothetical protein ACHAXA_001785 [Cyclostephanos tholiformis]|uniref:Uncharacterized protein n=1 Tax=Cyclostephanos tholiformis TaxID=382380 RepID=A0ABD3RXK6_9STRA